MATKNGTTKNGTKEMVTSTSQVPTAMTEEEMLAKQYAGAGVSTDAADNIVPQIKILQPLSPEVVESSVTNAKAGDFLIGSQLIDGKTGLCFQPCYWGQCWLEFKPMDAGGGFVAYHTWNGPNNYPEGATKLGEFRYKMGENELLHYRQWAGICWINKSPIERTLNFKGTGHTVAREWNNTAREANRFSNGTSRPLFFHLYQLTTEKTTNAKGTWFKLRVGPPILLTESNSKAKELVGDDVMSALKLGASLFEAFQGGQRRAEVDSGGVKENVDNIPF